MADEFDMPDASASFEERGGWLVKRLAADLGLTLPQAAGIVGNLGFESGGFKSLQEIAPQGGRGGYGWAQWTASRRRAFEAWCAAKGLKPSSDEANYGYLLVELRGAYSHTVDALKQTGDLAGAVFSFGQTFERPGGTTPSFLPGFADREHYAQRALRGVDTTVDDAVVAAIRALQTALADAGLYNGKIDADFGPMSQRALSAFIARAL